MEVVVLDRNKHEEFYYDHIQENVEMKKTYGATWDHYHILKPFYERIFPLSCVKPEYSVLQAGFLPWRIEEGLSHLCIFSILTGPDSQIIISDPDQDDYRFRAGSAMLHETEYEARVTFVKKAIWNRRMPGIIKDNRLIQVYTPRKGSKVPASEHKDYEILCDSVENILDRAKQPIHYLNLTINNCEPEGIDGIGRYIDEDITIAFPFSDILIDPSRPHSGERQNIEENISSLQYLNDKGYTVFIADAPPRKLKPEQRLGDNGNPEPWWYALATKDTSIINTLCSSHHHHSFDFSHGWPNDPKHFINISKY